MCVDLFTYSFIASFHTREISERRDIINLNEYSYYHQSYRFYRCSVFFLAFDGQLTSRSFLTARGTLLLIKALAKNKVPSFSSLLNRK